MKKFSQKIFEQIRHVVFGVEDGLISTLGVMTGIASGSNNKAIVILSSFIVVFVEALSMSAGTYLSSKSERQAQEKLIKEELEQIRKNPEKEREELTKFYRKRGYHESEIEKMVGHVMKDEKLLLEEMAHKELNIVLKKYENPVKSSIYMLASYVIGGIVVVIPYFILPVRWGIVLSVIFACIALYLLGYYKGHLTKITKSKSGFEMMVIALSVAIIGYILGKIIGHIIGLLE